MTTETDNLGDCPCCHTPLITNRQDERKYCHVSLEGNAPPQGAYFPDFYHTMHAVWCPACGLAKSVSFPDMDISCCNPEFIEWERRQLDPQAERFFV